MATAIIATGIGIVVALGAFVAWLAYGATKEGHKPTYECGIDDS